MTQGPFNRLDTPLDLLLSRRSGKARDMVAPGPSDEQLGTIMTAAIRVPDHGKLAPWRIVRIASDRRVEFATAIAAAYAEEKPGAVAAELQAMREFAMQAPTMLVVLSAPKAESHIPLWEQELSAGALCQNLLTAAHASGYVANWLTGWAAYSPAVLRLLGAAPNMKTAGFIFIGTAARPLDERPRPELGAICQEWPAA